MNTRRRTRRAAGNTTSLGSKNLNTGKGESVVPDVVSWQIDWLWLPLLTCETFSPLFPLARALALGNIQPCMRGNGMFKPDGPGI